ncbi:related to ATP-dependent RNA helicase ROK1 [Cephalotrichum gorgonifer]|uniref:ATP-dependent RNA helicase ROK1 n=1 Tax=Cephalotrichum gorgonifer TaxID=2041049 RepID=A0AAE8MZ71_9PEZI|nr:related to ATP-dependent RNA helicase ROK1 [Cephalotrichum gorgonifer]
MDILKVLSRGIKKPARAAGTAPPGSTAANIPSAGTKTRPQLYHDDVGTGRAQKRKRSGDEEEGDGKSSAADLPEVDFFAARDHKAKPARTESEPEPRTEPETGTAPAEPSRELTEDECRQILRSHRLKYTLLAGTLPRESDGENKRKKKKKKAKTEEKGKKEKQEGFYPRPLVSFSELRGDYGVAAQLMENIKGESYKIPTEVQLGSLPLLLRPSSALPGYDISGGEDATVDFMAVAPTGSGKTISFLIPTINRILKRREKEGLDRIHELEAVVIVPTRELAFQIVNEGRKLTTGTGLRVLQMKKGMQIAAEVGKRMSLDEESDEESDDASDSEEDSAAGASKAPLAKADILVTTPLALLNFLTNDEAKGNRVLPTVRTLILDEADVLLDPLFLDQTSGVWSACTNPDLQASFWSATMPSNIETLITDRLTTLATQPRPLIRLVVGLKDTAVPNVTHKLLYTASEAGKLLAIRQLLRPHSSDTSIPTIRPPFLVFTQTIERAAALESELRYDIPLEAGGSTRIASLHSGLIDSARSSIMKRFRAGEIWVLITTDVLARGVDFAGVNGIVNYDFPPSAATYVHRAGRTGRAGREGGMAITLYTKEDIPHAKTVANVIAASDKQAGKTGADAGVQKWLLDALPDVSKEEKKRLKRGVESRRSGAKAKITSQSGWERKREGNKMGAIEASKKRQAEIRRERRSRGDSKRGEDEEWGGFED